MAEDTDITSMLAGRPDARELGGVSKKADTDIWALIWSPDIGNVCDPRSHLHPVSWKQ